MPTWPSLVALEVVVVTIVCAASDGKVGIMGMVSFPCMKCFQNDHNIQPVVLFPIVQFHTKFNHLMQFHFTLWFVSLCMLIAGKHYSSISRMSGYTQRTLCMEIFFNRRHKCKAFMICFKFVNHELTKQWIMKFMHFHSWHCWYDKTNQNQRMLHLWNTQMSVMPLKLPLNLNHSVFSMSKSGVKRKLKCNMSC